MNFRNWIVLAIIGGVDIVAASVLERHGAGIRHQILTRRNAKNTIAGDNGILLE